MPPSGEQSGAAELAALEELAGQAEAMLADASPYLAEWRRDAAALREADALETLEGERALEALALSLRNAWLRTAHEISHRYLMAPLHEQAKFMPSGERFQYDYERSSRPENLERRGKAMTPPPEGWRSLCQLYASGMAAISTVVQVCCTHLDGATPDNPVRLKMFGGYFETWRLLDMYYSPALHVEYLDDNAALDDRIADSQADVVVIEPVAYDWDMTVFDLDAFGAAWAKAETPPRVVVVDASLSAHTLSVEDIIAQTGDRPPWIVIWLRSGLKLDQQGLELVNVGVVNFFVPTGQRHFTPEHLTTRLAAARSVMGSGLDVNRTAALEVPWFLNRDGFAAHAAAVFENNRALAEGVENRGGLFERIDHPALSAAKNRAWAVAPFVVFQLAEDTVNRLGLLVAVLVHEARARGLNLDLGSSFGFRGHRFEVIRPLVQIRERDESKGLLKIAMGSRLGPSVAGIIELVNDLAALQDWPALRAAYPDVKAYVKGNFGVYVEKPPRR